jgi:hypothetical protein
MSVVREYLVGLPPDAREAAAEYAVQNLDYPARLCADLDGDTYWLEEGSCWHLHTGREVLAPARLTYTSRPGLVDVRPLL